MPLLSHFTDDKTEVELPATDSSWAGYEPKQCGTSVYSILASLLISFLQQSVQWPEGIKLWKCIMPPQIYYFQIISIALLGNMHTKYT